MTYDEALAERIRQLVDTEPGLSETKMFGGLAFLIHGNMAVAASGEGCKSAQGLHARCRRSRRGLPRGTAERPSLVDHG